MKAVELARLVLPGLGFVDDQDQHPWNAVQFEKAIGSVVLTVWCRSEYEDCLFVQLYGQDDNMLHLIETNDEAVLREIISRVEYLLSFVTASGQ